MKLQGSSDPVLVFRSGEKNAKGIFILMMEPFAGIGVAVITSKSIFVGSLIIWVLAVIEIISAVGFGFS